MPIGIIILPCTTVHTCTCTKLRLMTCQDIVRLPNKRTLHFSHSKQVTGLMDEVESDIWAASHLIGLFWKQPDVLH